MSPIPSLRARRLLTRVPSAFRTIAFSLATLIGPASLPVASARDASELFAATPGASRTSPPDYVDSVHVAEGCYISTVAYLTKFSAAFPDEFGSAVTIHPKSHLTPHTIALLTWRDHWWLRDEFLGVLPVNLPVRTREITEQIKSSSEAALERRALRLSATRQTRRAGLHSRDDRVLDAPREVARAATLLQFASEAFHIESRGRKTCMLLFRPRPGTIAVYDPAHGTATAKTDLTSSVEIVALVAERLGYAAAIVRPASRLLVAAVSR